MLSFGLTFVGFILTTLGPDVYPRFIYFIDALPLVCLLGGVRVVNRVYRELGHSDGTKTVLVYGAGRSHVRSWTERIRKEWSHLRPYRCHDCGWRGWLAPVAAVQPPSLSDTPDVVDLQSIDAAVRNGARPSRPAFSPRNLS